MLPLELREELVPYDKIEPSDFRKVYSQPTIRELAEDIFHVGLVENLVGYVRGDKVRLRAGHRRWMAIGLLIEDGRWPRDRPVRVSIDSNMTPERDAMVAISEAIHQEAIYPWILGDVYVGLLDRGWKESEIGEKIGRSQTTVSLYVRLSRGLHPKIKEILQAIPIVNIPNVNRLGDVAKLCDRYTWEPDFERQKIMLEKVLNMPKAPKRSAAERAGVAFFASRVKELLGKVDEYPEGPREFLSSVLLFISGEKDDLPTWQHPLTQKALPRAASRSRATSSSRPKNTRAARS